MGQANGRQCDAPGVSGHPRHRSRDLGRGSARARARAAPPPPSPLAPSHRSAAPRPSSWPSTFDSGLLVPTGVYASTPQDYSHDIVKTLICARRLAPFYQGADDPDELAGCFAGRVLPTECPICMLAYPSPLNRTRCCAQPVCTECFVQARRPDPFQSNPPESPPATCPFCMTVDFGIIYAPPRALLEKVLISDRRPTEATAEPVADTDSDQLQRGVDTANPHVVTVDEIRPLWETQLEAAKAAQARKANRRIIMRNVNGHLVPVGVSSSRAGASLAGAPARGGGAVVSPGTGSRDRGSRSRSQAGARSPPAGGALEEAMLMEAIRQSLVEHEEEESRRAQQERPNAAANAAAQVATITHAVAVEETASTTQSTMPLPGNGPHVPSQDGMRAASIVPASNASHGDGTDSPNPAPIDSAFMAKIADSSTATTSAVASRGVESALLGTSVEAHRRNRNVQSSHESSNAALSESAAIATSSPQLSSHATRRSEEVRPSFGKLAMEWAWLPISASLDTSTALRGARAGPTPQLNHTPDMRSTSCTAQGRANPFRQTSTPSPRESVASSRPPRESESSVFVPLPEIETNPSIDLWNSDQPSGKPTTPAAVAVHAQLPMAEQRHAKQGHQPLYAYQDQSRRA